MLQVVGVSLDSMSSLLSWVRLLIITIVIFTVIILRALIFVIFIVVIMITITTILKVRGSAILSSFPLPLIADRSADLAKSFGVLQPAQRYV